DPHLQPFHTRRSSDLANKQYTLAISGDTAYTFNLFEGAALPSSPFNNGITVLGVYEGQHKQFPTIPADYTLPIGLLTNNNKVARSEEHTSELQSREKL